MMAERPELESFMANTSGKLELVPYEPAANPDAAARRDASMICELIRDTYGRNPNALMVGSVGKARDGRKRVPVTASLNLCEGSVGERISAVYTQGFEGGGRFEFEIATSEDPELEKVVAGFPGTARAGIRKVLTEGQVIDLLEEDDLADAPAVTVKS